MVRSVRTALSVGLSGISDWLERRPWMAALILVGMYIPCALESSRSTPLSHDELFTMYLSGAPTVRALWADVRSFDLNPPLSYLLTRLTGHLDGSGALGLRLPEILGFLMFLLGVFRFVRVRMGAAYGLFTGVLLMGSVLWELATLARPYALMLGFLALALVGWQVAGGEPVKGIPRRRLGVCLLGLGVCGMVFSHLFAVLSVAALAGAELWRGWSRKRTDCSVLGALVVPLLALPAYLPMLHAHGRSIFPPAFQPDGTAVFEFYTGSVDRELISLLLTALLVLVLLGPAHLRGGRGAGWFFTGAEWCGVILLMASPLVLIAELLATHGAFFARYGAPASVGVALLTAALLGRWTLWQGRPDGRAALLGGVVVLLTSGLASSWTMAFADGTVWPTRAHSEPAMQICQACLRTAALDPAVPLVDASGLTFVQMTHYESDRTMRRVFYLTDAAASEQYAHANIFERMGELVEHFHLRGQVKRYPEFLREHPRFFVFGRYSYPEDWLLRKLVADGAEVRMLGSVSDSYRDTELYEVRMGVANRLR